jgi:hypothetical protein
MNGLLILNTDSFQVKLAFSLEEAPCGPTTSVGGSTGLLSWPADAQDSGFLRRAIKGLGEVMGVEAR